MSAPPAGMRRTGPALAAADRISIVALGFAAGIAAAWHLPGLPLEWWAGATGAAAGLALLRRRSPRGQMLAIALAVTFAGGGWLTLRVRHVAPRSIDAALGPEPVLARVSGVAAGPPKAIDPPTGSMSAFDFRERMTCFPLRVRALIARDGRRAPRTGRVLVCVEETLAPFETGARIEVTGLLQRPPPPANPGAADRRALARAKGHAGVLRVPARDLVIVTERAPRGLRRAVSGWRDDVRRRARAGLLAGRPGAGAAPPDDVSRRDALLLALLLGERDGAAPAHDAFRRVGVAHLLAISGLHLGVVVSIAVFALGRRAAPRCRGALVVGIVLAYLLLVEARLPVLRAALMAAAVGLGLASGRRLRTASLVSLSGVLLLAWRPEELLQPGFQLSFGVVLGLVYFAPRVRERWFGPADRGAATSAQMLGQWLATGLAAAAVAWAIALPVIVHHFGMISPWGVPVSVLTLPLVAIVLVLGYVKIALAIVLPSGALLAGAVLAVAADLLLSIVEAVDALPGSVVHVTRPSAAWTLAALAGVAAWASGVLARRRRLAAGGGAVLAAWLAWPALTPAITPTLTLTPPLRLDMLAVGDGACHVVRSGGEVLVFDAGSISHPDAARRTLVPALRALGVRTIDTLAVSHANLDHFSAVIEVVDAFDVRETLVTAPFEAAAEAAPGGPAARLLEELGRRHVAVGRAAAGRAWALGSARVRCLHPPADAAYENDNDGSMVLSITARGRRVLLTGDLETRGVHDLSRRHPGLRADVVELPHHGAFDERVAVFVRGLAPTAVLQSTGVKRFRRDGWAGALAGVERLVTARDGACRVEIDRAGRIRVGRFADGGRLRPATTRGPPPPPRCSPAAARPRDATRRSACR